MAREETVATTMRCEICYLLTIKCLYVIVTGKVYGASAAAPLDMRVKMGTTGERGIKSKL